MELPKYHETFIPILDVLSGQGIISTNELKNKVLDKYYSNLPKELLSQRVKGGGLVILNRISWGKAYLKQAKMIKQPERGMVQISDKGLEVFKKGSLTLGELKKDSDFLGHRLTKKLEKEIDEISEGASPDDMLEAGLLSIESEVKNDLLDKLKSVDPYYFEKIVLRLLSGMGYGDFAETPKSGDGGIDGILNQDKLGFEKIYIQAKRYNENKVREKEIRNFIGAMSREATKGVFVTTSEFHESAIKKAQDASHKIILIDGNNLVDLMYEYNIGVQIKTNYELKEVDEDFFEE